MRALTLNGYDGIASIRLADVPEPELRPNDVLLEVRAASINPVDAKIAQGYARGRLDLKFPHVLGRDCLRRGSPGRCRCLGLQAG